eukprot:CAMPEP_0114511002 /NCGR_PEP_ID=MMETSP0109-20121206/14114_1 /TAXON_ID=29199 /ORGANISM="Chlorarachnion reptans, Strain CCCM449" /LENGTH=105 /DNA_ID=CAMNT_0001690399 /DNA_START=20 /DNA_END=334 /DNA_ORIENTATION=+
MAASKGFCDLEQPDRLPHEASELPPFEENQAPLKGGDDDDKGEEKPCFPWCYTSGPCGCILMMFCLVVGGFCWCIGQMFKCFVCVVTCPCPAQCACQACADGAAW